MQNYRNRLLPLSGLLSILLIDVFYIVLNHPTGDEHSLVTGLDRATPFLKVFILPYMSWQAFLFITLAYICFKDLRTYYRTLIAIDISLLICDTIFFFFQTTVPRPVLVGDDLLTRMVRALYNSDEPFNCFPSIHVLTSYVLLKAVNVSPKRTFWNQAVVSTIAVVIILSTLFIKQHVILDAIGGITIGGLVFTICYRFEQIYAWMTEVLPFSFMTEQKDQQIEQGRRLHRQSYDVMQANVEEAVKASKKIS